MVTSKHFRYVKIDETKYWDRDFVRELGPKSKIIATYAYDVNERIYCTKDVPSYFLYYMGTELVPGRNLTNSELEEYKHLILDNEIYNDHAHFSPCSYIDQLTTHPVKLRKHTDYIGTVIQEYQENPW
jgi:hypothetical protein